MSIRFQNHGISNVQIRGNAVVLSDMEALRKEELERRRKLRLEQVGPLEMVFQAGSLE